MLISYTYIPPLPPLPKAHTPPRPWGWREGKCMYTTTASSLKPHNPFLRFN